MSCEYLRDRECASVISVSPFSSRESLLRAVARGREDEPEFDEVVLEEEERSRRRHCGRGDRPADQRLAQVPREQECGDRTTGRPAGPVDTSAQYADLKVGAERASRCRAACDQVLQLLDQA